MITEKLTKRQKITLLSSVVLYFVVGFFLIVFFMAYLIGANAAGLLALAYIGLGWYFLIKRNGLFGLIKVKHD